MTRVCKGSPETKDIGQQGGDGGQKGLHRGNSPPGKSSGLKEQILLRKGCSEERDQHLHRHRGLKTQWGKETMRALALRAFQGWKEGCRMGQSPLTCHSLQHSP